jgi:hypothetical protein
MLIREGKLIIRDPGPDLYRFSKLCIMCGVVARHSLQRVLGDRIVLFCFCFCCMCLSFLRDRVLFVFSTPPGTAMYTEVTLKNRLET